MKKISKIRCMSSKLIVKLTKCCRPHRLAPTQKMAESFRRPSRRPRQKTLVSNTVSSIRPTISRGNRRHMHASPVTRWITPERSIVFAAKKLHQLLDIEILEINTQNLTSMGSDTQDEIVAVRSTTRKQSS